MIKYTKSGNGYVLTEATSRQTKIIPKKEIKNTFSSLDKHGTITLLPGFWWDGATGAIDTPSIMEASCYHDFICNEYNNKKLTIEQRKLGDKMFKNINKESSMPSIRVKWTYQFVRKFLELKDWFRGR